MILLKYQYEIMEKDEVKKQIEETNEYRKENFLEILLENMYPGFAEYLKAIRDTEHKGIATPLLEGTQDQIEETRQLIKESNDNLTEDNCEQGCKNCDCQKEQWISVDTLPKYLGDTMQERIDNYFKLKNANIDLIGLPQINSGESHLQEWIDNGKKLIEDEINIALENLEKMYDTLSELNDEINDEEERIERLENLLNTISL